jgi:predicted nucleic acid-binding Zn ribbon protein
VRRSRPRPIGGAFQRVVEDSSPQTLLARVQSAWPRVTGETIAEQATPVLERDGEVTVACRSASWAQELDLLSERLLGRLNESLGGDSVRALRFTADAVRHEPRPGG